MGESENLHCEHNIRNEHVRYSTNLSTKTPRGRISKNENRNKILYFDIQIFSSFSFVDGESENFHCEHDIRNEHVRYSTNLSTKTPRGRISKNENRNKILYFDIQIFPKISFVDG